MRCVGRRRVAVVALLLALIPLTGGCADSARSGPLRVMVVGDSISQGLPGDATWRYWFARAFVEQHVPLDMVGPTTGEKNDLQAYERPWRNTAHAAVGGSTLDDHLPVIESEVRTYHPDVVVVELGINDRKQHDSPTEIAEQTQQLTDRIWAADPHVRIVWTQILAQASRDRTPRVSHDRVTAATDRLIESTLGSDPRVTIAYTQKWDGGHWQPVHDTTDGTHPNASGQTLLAERIADAFHDMGVLPAAPHVARQRTWAPRLAPVVSQGPAGRLVVDWSKAAISCWTTAVRVVVRDARGQSVRRQLRSATPYAADNEASYRLPAGRYTVTLAPIRHWMIGAPSDPVAFTLRPIRHRPARVGMLPRSAGTPAYAALAQSVERITRND